MALDVPPDEQDRRLVDPNRAAFGKLRSLDILHDLRTSMNACMQAMPSPALRIATGAMTPAVAADAIVHGLALLG